MPNNNKFKIIQRAQLGSDVYGSMLITVKYRSPTIEPYYEDKISRQIRYRTLHNRIDHIFVHERQDI